MPTKEDGPGKQRLALPGNGAGFDLSRVDWGSVKGDVSFVAPQVHYHVTDTSKSDALASEIGKMNARGLCPKDHALLVETLETVKRLEKEVRDLKEMVQKLRRGSD